MVSMYALRHKPTQRILRKLDIGGDESAFSLDFGEGVWTDHSLAFVYEVKAGKHFDKENVPAFTSAVKASDCEIVQLGIVAVF